MNVASAPLTPRPGTAPGDTAPAAAPVRWSVGRVRWAVALAALLLMAWWVVGLGAAPLFDVDEGAFAEASREMLASGDWGHTTLNGADRFDKPILVYWLQAASLAAFGVNEFAVRLPSALCAWGWCVALAAFAWPRFGATVACVAAGMLATSLGPALIGRAATADALLNLLIALAAFDLWRSIESSGAAPRRRAFLWIGLGLLAKGPVALLIPAAAVLLWSLSKQAWPVLRKLAGDPIAWALMLAASAPWYVYALDRHGQAFIDGFIVRHNLARYSAPLEAHGGSALYYVFMLPLLLWPWTPLLASVLRRARSLWRDELSRYLLCWAGFVLVFFSFSGTKLPHYALYGATPLLLLAARELQHAGRWMLTALLGCCAVLAAIGPAGAWLAGAAGAQTADPLWRALLLATAEQAIPHQMLQVLLALGMALAMVVALATVRARAVHRDDAPGPGARRRGAWGVGAALLAMGCFVSLCLPWWALGLQGAVRSQAQRARDEGRSVVQWRVHQPSFAFYLGRPAPRREPRPPEWALTRLDRMSAEEARAWTVVTARGPLALVRPRDATDPAPP